MFEGIKVTTTFEGFDSKRLGQYKAKHFHRY